MSDAIETQGTTLEIETGSGGAKTITGITLGAITEVTSVAHGLSVGDVVTFASIVGTTDLNGVTAMIIAKETDSMFFNIDSSAYDAYVSGGTATPVSYTIIGEVTDFDGPGGSASVIDVTHLASTRKEKLVGLPDEGQFTFSLNMVPGDTGQVAMRTSRGARTLKGYRLTLSDLTTIATFDAYCLNFSVSGAVDGKMAAKATLEITGAVEWTDD